MKSECQSLENKAFTLIILVNVVLLLLSAPPATAYLSPPTYIPSVNLVQPDHGAPELKELQWPEQYIEPAMNYGLNLVLPKPLRDGLMLDAGYDRWAGMPTLKADYFLPVKAWSDKSIFLTPRLSLTGTRETFSVGAGIRRLINSETLVGFHAFHDWVRPRGSTASFLKEAGVGLELSALPGMYSDLSLSVNAYVPINERRLVSQRGRALVKETLPYGADAQVGLLLPPLVDSMDIRVDAAVHTYRAEQTNLSGYTAGITLSSRDGMLSATVEQGRDTVNGENINVRGSLNLAFDWTELLAGQIPFSAPYSVPAERYNRRIRDSLYARTARQHDLPTDRTERPITLASTVLSDTVSFRGSFPDLPNSLVTVQVSQSPWRDITDVVTDSKGRYSGKISLAPGKYRFRLIHKKTGLVTHAAKIVIHERDAAGSLSNR